MRLSPQVRSQAPFSREVRGLNLLVGNGKVDDHVIKAGSRKTDGGWVPFCLLLKHTCQGEDEIFPANLFGQCQKALGYLDYPIKALLS